MTDLQNSVQKSCVLPLCEVLRPFFGGRIAPQGLRLRGSSFIPLYMDRHVYILW